MEVWRKAISIALSVTCIRNVEEVALVEAAAKDIGGGFRQGLFCPLHQQLVTNPAQAADYRQLLAQSIHVMAIKFSQDKL